MLPFALTPTLTLPLALALALALALTPTLTLAPDLVQSPSSSRITENRSCSSTIGLAT